jgi:hypothetical protein
LSLTSESFLSYLPGLIHAFVAALTKNTNLLKRLWSTPDPLYFTSDFYGNKQKKIIEDSINKIRNEMMKLEKLNYFFFKFNNDFSIHSICYHGLNKTSNNKNSSVLSEEEKKRNNLLFELEVTKKIVHPNFERRLLFGCALSQTIRFQSKTNCVYVSSIHHTSSSTYIEIPAPVVS